ncbi:putative uncharacterized protein [Bacteroides sp. CAG:714]|nr:putative uncharacterized protein [Bacteroides sp. CAG:714]
MRNVFLNAVGVCAMLSLMASCSSTEDIPMNNDGYGTVSLNILTDTQFESRAVDESAYSNLDNYTVQILKDGKVVSGMEWKYADIPEEVIELTNGGYELKAFYGEDKAASTTGMYVEGIKTFNVNSDQSQVEVTCQPVCARVKVEFDTKMAEYYQDYSVAFHTLAIANENADLDASFVWTKTNTDPVYLKVSQKESVKAVITLVDKKSKTTTIDKSYELSPNEALKMKIVPTVSQGNLGIVIDVDETTNDIPVDIEIPSEWIDEQQSETK